MAVATGAVVRGTFVAVAEDEVPGHPISPGRKISIFPARTTKENRIVLNTVQLNTIFRIATVQGLLKKKKTTPFPVLPKTTPLSVPKTTLCFVLGFNRPIPSQG